MSQAKARECKPASMEGSCSSSRARRQKHAFPGMRDGRHDALPYLCTFAPNLKDRLLLEGCGHWTQQERAEEVNVALLAFLRAR